MVFLYRFRGSVCYTPDFFHTLFKIAGCQSPGLTVTIDTHCRIHISLNKHWSMIYSRNHNPFLFFFFFSDYLLVLCVTAPISASNPVKDAGWMRYSKKKIKSRAFEPGVPTGHGHSARDSGGWGEAGKPPSPRESVARALPFVSPHRYATAANHTRVPQPAPRAAHVWSHLVATDERIDKQNVVYPYSRVLCSFQKE